jgi:hypothetical protein
LAAGTETTNTNTPFISFTGAFPPSRGGGPIGNAVQSDAEPFRIYAEDSLGTGNGVTGLTITATLCKNGAASFSAVTPTYTDLGNGWYRVTPIAAHRDTLGESTWRFSATGAIIADRREIVKVNSLDGYFAKLFRWLGILAGKGSDPATLAEINATDGGATFNSATDSLEAQAEAGASVNVLPAVGISASRAPGVFLSPFVGELISQSITVYASDGTTPIDLSAKTLEIVFEARGGVDVAVIDDGDIAISGDDDNVVTFAYPTAVTVQERTLRFSLRDKGTPFTVYLTGLCKVSIAPSNDPA